jgi:hypothetical protein|tara:strand:- start:1259 stop:2770 length:1512 start_codon:yes stop_codon:yes gene_type:complete
MPNLYEAYPWQKEMHESKAKIKFVQAGRRAGKTRSALQEALRQIREASINPVQFPGKKERLTAEQAGLVPPIHIWTVAPTRAQMMQVWNEMQAFIPKHIVRKTRTKAQAGGRGGGFKQDDLHVWLDLKDEKGNWLPNRWRQSVFWELKSADNPEGLQTVGLDFLHMAESQDIKEAAWNKVRPTLNSPGRLGRAIVEGVPPESSQHWFARNFKIAKENPSVRREAFHASTFDNPYLTEDDRLEIEEEKGSLTEGIWERFYMAKQPEGAGNFFRNITAAYSSDAYEMMKPDEQENYVAGLDLGRTNDATVMIIKNRVTRTSVFAVELMKTDWSLQLETIKREAIRWNLQEIYMDSTGLGGKLGEDVLYRELLEHSIPIVGYNFTPSKKYQLFLDYALSLEKETVAFPQSFGKLISQLEDIAHRETANRGHQFYSVSGGRDDWVDAECLALMACDPASDVIELLATPRSKRGIKPLNNNYRNKGSRLLEWRRLRKELLEQEGIETL